MKEKFIQFLKDNNCLEQFEANVAKSYGDKTSYALNILVDLTGAFTWRDTPEGYTYWDAINDKWESL